jgi:hypothetical protein
VSRVQVPTAVTATRVIAVLRGLDPDRVEALVGVLCHSGVTSVEITMDSPNAASLIERSLGAVPSLERERSCRSRTLKLRLPPVRSSSCHRTPISRWFDGPSSRGYR